MCSLPHTHSQTYWPTGGGLFGSFRAHMCLWYATIYDDDIQTCDEHMNAFRFIQCEYSGPNILSKHVLTMLMTHLLLAVIAKDFWIRVSVSNPQGIGRAVRRP